MKLNVVLGIITQNDKVLVCLRPKHLQHGGQWEFPGGKIHPNEWPLDALKRELFEEVGIKVLKACDFFSTEYQYPHQCIRFKCFLVKKFSGLPFKKEGQPEILWADIKSLPQFDFPEANFQIINQLIELF